jgi:hypothetical protein
MSSELEGDLNGDGIIDEMDRVRGDLDGEINQLGKQMKNVFNWQAYVKSAPITSVIAAAFVGYLVAPRIRSRAAPAPTGSFNAYRNSNSAPSSIGGMLKSMVWSGLARAGSVYVAEMLTRGLDASHADSGNAGSTPESDEPAYD